MTGEGMFRVAGERNQKVKPALENAPNCARKATFIAARSALTSTFSGTVMFRSCICLRIRQCFRCRGLSKRKQAWRTGFFVAFDKASSLARHPSRSSKDTEDPFALTCPLLPCHS